MRYQFGALLPAFAAIVTICSGQPRPPLVPAGQIALPGVHGRIDHLSADPPRQLLVVSALGNGTVEIVDLGSGRRERELEHLREPQGVLIDPESKRLFVACGGDGTVRSYDAATFAPLKTVDLGDDADNVRYDSRNDDIVVGYGSGGLATFDASLREISKLRVPAHPESFQIEQHGPKTFVNLPDSREIAVVDRTQNRVLQQWHDFPAQSNFPMALDEANHRLFVGFRAPARLMVFDTGSGKVVASLPAVGDTDDLFYDSTLHRIYMTGGEGWVDVFQQRDPDHYESIARVPTSPGARTGLYVSALRRLFVAAPLHGAEPARILVYRTE